MGKNNTRVYSGNAKHSKTFNAFGRILIEETDTIAGCVSNAWALRGRRSSDLTSSGKRAGMRMPGAKNFERLMTKFFAVTGAEGKEKSGAILEGRINEEEPMSKIAERSDAVGRMFPNSRCLIGVKY